MYAIVATGGKQYKVSAGDKIKVEKFGVEPESTIELEDVLLIADGEKIEIGQPKVEGAKVSAKVLSHGRGEKLVAFKKRRRKGSQRKVGHRQEYTELEIKAISGGVSK